MIRLCIHCKLLGWRHLLNDSRLNMLYIQYSLCSLSANKLLGTAHLSILPWKRYEMNPTIRLRPTTPYKPSLYITTQLHHTATPSPHLNLHNVSPAPRCATNPGTPKPFPVLIQACDVSGELAATQRVLVFVVFSCQEEEAACVA